MAKQAKKKRAKTQTEKVTKPQTQVSGSNDAVSLLMADHRSVEQLFERYRAASSEDEKAQIAKQVCTELGMHAELEEEIFYPACREEKVEGDVLDEAQVEHDGAKVLINDLLQGSVGDEFYDAKMTVLEQYIRHHVAEEEKPTDGIFAQARSRGVDLDELGQRLQARKNELATEAQNDRFVQPQIHSLMIHDNQQTEGTMARYQDRDERGRFESEDERGSSRRRGRDDYEESGRGRGGWSGDSEGHSRAAEMRWEGASRSRRRDEDDEDESGGRSRGRGQGGWFGDPEGHSRASERGWEERSGSYRSRGGGREDDDEDESGRGRGHGGWFGDPEGHSRASEKGWEERERGGGYRSRGGGRREDYEEENGGRGRGHGGWFGDPEGHARASEKGWEERGSSGSRYRGSEDDDRGRGRGHGGWFGDSEGHARAAERRWEGESRGGSRSRGRER